MMQKKAEEDSRHLRELGELRAQLWLIANDPETPRAVQVQALKELRVVSEAMQAGEPVKVSSKVAQLDALRLKAVQGGKK